MLYKVMRPFKEEEMKDKVEGPTMTARRARAVGLALLLILLIPVTSWAHGFAGKRFFPTTFQVDDPFIGDEFSILLNSVKTPDGKTNEMDIGYSKRILPNFGIEFDESYQHVTFPDGSSASGFGNLGFDLKYQFLTNAEHEMILSVGVGMEIGGTGAMGIGASTFSTYSPTFYFGKGFGDLPDSLNILKPLAITGVINPSFPSQGSTVTFNPDTGENDITKNSTTFFWGFTLQYSLIYLQSFVKDIGLGAPFNRMILVTEFPMTTCLSGDCKGQITGTVNPGIVWCGKYTEFGLAAQIPINKRSGNTVGILGLIHIFIDDLFPKSIGAPIFH